MMLIAVGALVYTCSAAAAGPDYLRGGIGLHQAAETVFLDSDCSSTSPAALYGCGTGGDGAPRRSIGDIEKPAAWHLGVGWQLRPALRLEAQADYRARHAFAGRANFLAPGRRQEVAAEISSTTAMLAAYVDLPALGVPRLGPFAPFAGAGLGIARTRIGEMRMTFPATTTVVPGDRHAAAAWMVSGGVSAKLGGSMTLDLAWRYDEVREIRTGEGQGWVIWRNGRREPLQLDLAHTQAELRRHGLRLSFRYSF